MQFFLKMHLSNLQQVLASMVMGTIAPVGQTSLQRVQSNSHSPLWYAMWGCMTPISPYSRKEGCKTLVGQADTHSEQPVQILLKRPTEREPEEILPMF